MILEIGNADHRVTVEVASASGVRRVSMDGRDIPYDWVRLANGHYSLIIGGRVYDFLIEFSNGDCSVIGRGHSYALRVEDALRVGERVRAQRLLRVALRAYVEEDAVPVRIHAGDDRRARR